MNNVFGYGGTVSFRPLKYFIDQRDHEPLIVLSQWVGAFFEVVSLALVYHRLPLTNEILANPRNFDHGISVDEAFPGGATISFGILSTY